MEHYDNDSPPNIVKNCNFGHQPQQPSANCDCGPNPHTRGRTPIVSKNLHDGFFSHMSQTCLEPEKDCTEHTSTRHQKFQLREIKSVHENNTHGPSNCANATCFGLSSNRYLHSTSEEKQKSKTKLKYTADIIVEIKDCHGNVVPIKALLDTGTDESLVLKEFVHRSRVQSTPTKRVKWTTVGGEFSTKRQALLEFSFPELAPNKQITWTMHV